PFVTVAAINGPALGGGLEIALACDTRIAADAPNVRVGLTETRLGLIPAAGGTQRLPRLIGLPRALDMILTARQLAPKRALRAGVIDEVVHPAVLLRAAIDHATRDTKRKPKGGATVVERAATHFAPARAIALRQRKAAFEGLGKPRAIANVGVVGLGFMGSGIAQAAAASGLRVRARDRDAAAVATGLSSIRALTTDAAKKGVFERREAARIVGRVTG